jgi:hypothetical protein
MKREALAEHHIVCCGRSGVGFGGTGAGTNEESSEK